MLMYPNNHKFYYVIEDSYTENDAMAKRRQGEEALNKCKQIDPDRKL